MLHKALIISLPILFISCSYTGKKAADINNVIVEIQKKYAPDLRESRFDVKAKIEKRTIILSGETDSQDAKTELINQLEKFHLSIENNINLLPDTTIGLKPFALVTVSIANFRSSPAHSAEMVTQALMGTPVKLLKKDGGWYLAQMPDHYIAWVDNGGIHPVTEQEHQAWKSADRVIIRSDYGTIRVSSEKDAANVSDFTMGMIMEKLDAGKGIISVKTPDGRIGFIPDDCCEDFNKFKNDTILRTENMIRLAFHLNGRPYLWGGTSALGMDCSGFVKTVFFMNGVIIARDASLQVRHGQIITTDPDFKNYQPCDLLFFGKKATNCTKERITHVGLAINNETFINESGTVRINSLLPDRPEYSEYRYKSFVKAVRVIGFGEDYGIQYVRNHPWY